MTVKELIEKLKEYNPDMNVLIESKDPTYYMYKSQIKTIGEGHPYDEGGYSGIDNKEMSVNEFDEFTDEFFGEKVLLIDIGMV
jgi:hypothetical protein